MVKRQPIAWIVLLYIVGIVGHFLIPISILFGCVLLAIFMAGSMVFRNKAVLSNVFLAAAIMALGLIMTSNYELLKRDDIYHLSYAEKRFPVRIEGIVSSDIQRRAFFKSTKINFILKVKRVKTKWGWKKKSGQIQVTLFSDPALSYGDYISLEGKLHRPFDFSKDQKFSYREYLYRKGTRLMLSVKKENPVEILSSGQGNRFVAASLNFKHRLGEILSDHLSKNEAGFLRAILLGDRVDISKPINELFVRTGTAHILAISGLNVGFIAVIIFALLKMFPVPRRIQYVLTIGFLIFYCFLTGASPSVVRATIMAVIFLMSYILEREEDSLNALAWAALIILLMNPLNLFDVGFQLSFVSVLGIILFYSKAVNLLNFMPVNRDNKVVDFVVQSLGISLAAWSAVAGLLTYYFQIITPVTILANLFIIPLTSLITALGLGLLAAGMVCPSVTFLFASCTKFCVNLMVILLYLFDKIPGAFFFLQTVPVWFVVVYYFPIFVFLNRHALEQVLRSGRKYIFVKIFRRR